MLIVIEVINNIRLMLLKLFGPELRGIVYSPISCCYELQLFVAITGLWTRMITSRNVLLKNTLTKR